MPLVLLNQGEAFILQALANANLTLHLFTNNIMPQEDDVSGMYDEPVGGGYAHKTLLAGDWIITEGGPSVMAHPRQDFIFSGIPVPATIYGYFVRAGGLVLWAERGAAPFTVQQATDEYRVVPRFTQD